MADDKKELATRRRNSFLESLGAEDDPYYRQYLDRMTPDRQARVSRHIQRVRTGLHTVAPIICGGPARCPFYAHCPIPTPDERAAHKLGKHQDQYPVALPCLLESQYQRQKIADYCRHLEVDPENPVEIALVNELALLDMQKNRALMIMSAGDPDGQGRDFLRQDEDYTEVADGFALVKTTAVHPVFEIVDKLERRRERLLERLLQTRKSRADMELRAGTAAEDSNLMNELRQVRELLQQGAANSAVDVPIIKIED